MTYRLLVWIFFMSVISILKRFFRFKLLPYFCNMSSERDFFSGVQWKTEEIRETDVITEELHNLIVWNDDVNTFDWVIESLVDICGHETMQAEQCALIIHHKGKCGVKKGSFDDLRPQAEALIDRGIQATIDY
jgi:ATP-dependent Clp protease adaptor protein ClpS